MPMPQLRPHPTNPHQLRRKLIHAKLDVGRCAACSQASVLQRDRRTEDSHDSITSEILQHASVSADTTPHCCGGDWANQIEDSFLADPLRHRSEVYEVGEHDRDVPSDAWLQVGSCCTSNG